MNIIRYHTPPTYLRVWAVLIATCRRYDLAVWGWFLCVYPLTVSWRSRLRVSVCATTTVYDPLAAPPLAAYEPPAGTGCAAQSDH